jgi:adenylate kinase
MGDIFRRAAAEPGALGREIAAHLERGDLVPDKYVLEALVRATHSEKAAVGFVLDGYPRRENQVAELEELLGDRRLDKVVFLDVPREEAARRAKARRICSKSDCGEVYGDNSSPDPDGRCTRCGSSVVARVDDAGDTLKHRYDLYEAETVPAIRLYEEQGLLLTVAGTGDPDLIHERIMRGLGLR